jgi:hypothetical protein
MKVTLVRIRIVSLRKDLFGAEPQMSQLGLLQILRQWVLQAGFSS